MDFTNINRKNYLVCFLSKTVDKKPTCEPLKLWKKAGNGKKKCLETMKYARPPTWHPQMCIGLRFMKGRASVTSITDEKKKICGSSLSGTVPGSLVCEEPGGSHLVLLSYVKESEYSSKRSMV